MHKVEILFLIIGQWFIYHKIRPRRMKSEENASVPPTSILWHKHEKQDLKLAIKGKGS